MMDIAVCFSVSPLTASALMTESSSGADSLCCISRWYSALLIETPLSTTLMPCVLKIAVAATTSRCSPSCVTASVKWLRSSGDSDMVKLLGV